MPADSRENIHRALIHLFLGALLIEFLRNISWRSILSVEQTWYLGADVWQCRGKQAEDGGRGASDSIQGSQQYLEVTALTCLQEQGEHPG